jgi:hypothetical protein
MEAHIDRFTEIDYLRESRYLLMGACDVLFGEEMDDADITTNPIINNIKRFISSVAEISKELREWAYIITPVPIPELKPPDAPVIEEPTDITEDSGMIPMIGRRPFTAQVSITSYDISSDRLLSYEELRKLTMNIARAKLQTGTVRDEIIVALEKEKKRNLINEIKEFQNVRKIYPYVEHYDLENMTIEQLETCKDVCERYHNRFVVEEVMSSGFNLVSLGYENIFPEGIPISKTKRIRFGGIGKDVREKLFDTRGIVGFSFSRLLNKYNIHITDEMTVLISIGEKIISNAEIVTVGKEKKKKETNDSDSDSESSGSINSESNELEEV